MAKRNNKGVPPKAADFSFSDSQLDFCCGVTVVGDFDADDTNNEGEKINWSSIPTAVAASLRRQFNDLGRTAVATTVLRYKEWPTTGQTEVNKVLSRTGWKKVKDFKNRSTGNTLRMWIFTPTTKR